MADGSERDASERRGWRLRAVAAGVALVLLASGLAASLSRDGSGASAQAPPGQSGGSAPVGGAPPATARFVVAYGHGDYATIERIASPLYFVEWARQGVSLGDQASLLQDHQHAPTGEWLYFSYATGFVDNLGFGHYLYVGRPISASGLPSVWRVDADGSGRVIWIEMVWLFSGGSLAVQALSPEIAKDDSALRSLIPAGPSDVMFGVHSVDGHEGYYGVGPQSRSVGAAGSAESVQFYAVDDSGSFRLPVWSYGERFPNRPLAGRQQLQPEQARILSDYLASIH